MKPALLSAAFIALHVIANAQCSSCKSLEEAFKNPSAVRHLDLSNQGLSELPDSIHYLTGLETIDLSDNFFTALDLKNSRLESVYKLDLSGNIGLDPMEMDKIAKAFPNLLNLDISGCHMAFLTPQIGTLSKLISLDLSHNKLVALPEELKNMRDLNTLNVQDNAIVNITYVLSNCWNLRNLNVAENSFDPNAMLISVAQCENLGHLTWSGGDLSHDGSNALAGLRVRSMEIVGTKAAALPGALVRNGSISSLCLTNCNFKTDICILLQNMPYLDNLTLEHTEVPERISKLDQLSSLTLKNVAYPGNNTLSKLDFLTDLDLTGINVPDSVTQQLPTFLSNTNIRTCYFEYSPEMVQNAVSVIRTGSAMEQQIPGDRRVQMAVETIALDIPEKAFLNADGSVYSGTVTVKVTNYDNAIDNALAGMPMIYNNNGQDEVFSSAGMLDFRATDAAGNELKANPDPANQIQVSMLNLQPESKPKLYLFNPKTQAWEESSNDPVAINLDKQRTAQIDSVNQLDLKSFVSFLEIPTPFALRVREKRWDPTLLDFSYIKGNIYPRYNKRSQSIFHYTLNGDARMIANKNWRIDTIVTPALMEKLMEIQCSTRKIRKNKIGYDNAPRFIQDLKVEPDFENDNYRMSFRYKDTLISLPVFMDMKSTRSRVVMQNYSRFQRSYQRALKKEVRDSMFYARNKDKITEDYALQVRQMIIEKIRGGNTEAIEQLRFGLASFGLINCDYFFSNPPDRRRELASTITDQNGQSIQSPESVRTVLPESNVYFSSGSRQIPEYDDEATILLLPISNSELGIIKLGVIETNGKITSFYRADISGKSSAEVFAIINNL